MKINWNIVYSSGFGFETRMPRKIKKRLLGKRLNKSRLKKLLDSVRIIDHGDSGSHEVEILPYSFCPKCGCRQVRFVNMGVEYPERWVKIFCARCNFLVEMSDNSPYIHCLECKDDNYIL